jgi:Coenzyme PQQ synthesis protein D (PqqD)
MTTALSDCLKVPEEVLTAKVGEETVLLNLKTGMYHSLDPTGTRFLELLKITGGLEAVHRAMMEEFDVPAGTLEADLLKLSQDMLTRGLLVKVGE